MSLVDPDDRWGMWASVATVAVVGQNLEGTPVGKSLSGAVCSMIVSSILTNTGVLPAEASPCLRDLQARHMFYESKQGFVVKLATPLLLLGADLSKIFLLTGSLLRAFFLAAFGTALGAIAGTFVLSKPLQQVDQAWETTSAIAAKNIGGGLNFMAVADLLRLDPPTVSTALAVDNVLGMTWVCIRCNRVASRNHKQATVNEMSYRLSVFRLSYLFPSLAIQPLGAVMKWCRWNRELLRYTESSLAHHLGHNQASCTFLWWLG
ncbi:unnamed protein product [Discosporangium mesarthrocarpum]